MRSGNSRQICGNCGILHPLGIREGLKNRSQGPKNWSRAVVVTVTGSTPKFSTPEKYVPWKLVFRCENHFRLIFWRPGDLKYVWCLFLEGWNVHPSMHLFIQVTTHLNSILSLWISWWANATAGKFNLMTRPNQKKDNHVLIHPFSKKKTGAKTPKKLPETLNAAIGPISSSPGCKSLILLMQISQSQWNIAQDIDLAYDTRMDIGEWLIEIRYELFTEPNGHIKYYLKSQSFQCCGRINISNGSYQQASDLTCIAIERCARACITLDGMRLCFYPILSKSWALTKAIVTNRDPVRVNLN